MLILIIFHNFLTIILNPLFHNFIQEFFLKNKYFDSQDYKY